MDSGGLLLNVLPSRVDSRKCLSKAEWILANPCKSRVTSRKPFTQSRVDSRKCLSKSSGFSQMFIKAEWILANVYQSRVDSRKSCAKPSGFWRNLLRSQVDSRKSCAKPSGFWRNLLRNHVDFRQTFISQTDSLQVFFFLVKKVIPVCLVQRCHQSKCLFLQTISLQIHFKIPQCRFKVLFPFIYLHTTINTVVDNPFPQ